VPERILYDADGNEVRVPEPEDGSALRARLEAALAEKAALEAKWDAAAPIVEQAQASARVEKVRGVFVQGGLTEKAAEAFLLANPNGEATPEVVSAYAERFPEFKAQPGTPEPASQQQPPTPPQHGFTFQPTPPNAGTPPEQSTVDRSEVDALMYAGRIEEAKRLLASGRVKLHNPSAQERLDADIAAQRR
jgi:hypothetical protein